MLIMRFCFLSCNSSENTKVGSNLVQTVMTAFLSWVSPMAHKGSTAQLYVLQKYFTSVIVILLLYALTVKYREIKTGMYQKSRRLDKSSTIDQSYFVLRIV